MNFLDAKKFFDKIGIELNEYQFSQFENYEKELLEWNKNINLTAITEDKDIFIKHFVDSCTILKYINDNAKVIDVGTGAGFPGIPIKIINPTISLTLLDSLNKRINFLNAVCEKLDLENVNLIHSRAEDGAHDNSLREQFDIVTARAVANLSTLSEYCLPFVNIGGKFICMKAGNASDEIENAKYAINKLGGRIEIIDEFELPVINDKRTIIVISKINNTPKLFPRKAGTPSKEPLSN